MILLLPALVVACVITAATPVCCVLAFVARRINPPTAHPTVPLSELPWQPVTSHRKPNPMRQLLHFLSDWSLLIGMAAGIGGLCLFAKLSPESFAETSIDHYELPTDTELIAGQAPAGREVASHRAGAA